MSKITGKVNPGIKDGERKESVVAYLQRVEPPGSVTTTNYLNQTYGSHNRSTKIVSTFRPFRALPYRVFAGRYEANNYDFTYETGTVTKIKWRRWGKTPVVSSIGSGVSLYWGTKLSGGLRVPDVNQNMINRATTEALNNLNDNKANVYATLAEAKESIDLLVTMFTRLVRSILLARRGLWGQAYRVLTGKRLRGRDTTGSRAWLTYQYALRPAMSDIKGIIDYVQQETPKSPIVFGRRFVSSDYGLPLQPVHYKTWSVGGRCEVGAEVSIYAKISNIDTYYLNQLAVFNPFLLAWELVTLSFVIDWLIPIGNSLQALTADIGLVFVDGYTNLKTVSDFSFSGVNVDGAIGALPSARIQNVCQFRYTMTSFPYPAIYFKSPFSTTNLINALALFAVLRK